MERGLKEPPFGPRMRAVRIMALATHFWAVQGWAGD